MPKIVLELSAMSALNENDFDHWTNDEEAKEIIRKNAVGKPMLK